MMMMMMIYRTNATDSMDFSRMILSWWATFIMHRYISCETP